MGVLHWIIYFIALKLRQIYWFLFRPRTIGVKCLVQYKEEVLLIRNTYGSKTWTLPGGGMKRGETPLVAITREVSEEVGIEGLVFKELGVYTSTLEHKRDTIYCFKLRVSSRKFFIDEREIVEAKWFELSSMPNDVSKSVKEAIRFLNT